MLVLSSFVRQSFGPRLLLRDLVVKFDLCHSCLHLPCLFAASFQIRASHYDSWASVSRIVVLWPVFVYIVNKVTKAKV